MKQSDNNLVSLLENKKAELEDLIEKGVHKNAKSYAYYFNRWHADVLYLIEQYLGSSSKVYSRIEKAAKLPAGKATVYKWIKIKGIIMTKTYAELQAVIDALKRQPAKSPTNKTKSEDKTESFINSERLNNLRSLKSDRFDLSKLITLCEELNKCYSSHCYLASGMIMRSIVDHVPPIFGSASFSDVSKNYQGTQSFKESMVHLDKSLRKIADSFLHTHVRKNETLPTKTQVNFSQDFDVLLSEIERILK